MSRSSLITARGVDDLPQAALALEGIVSPFPIGDTISPTRYIDILEYLKHPLEGPLKLKFIGKGMRARVFWLPDKKRVLKLTKDEDDAEASAKLIGKRMKHLLHVYDVFLVDDIRKPVYGIVAEKLTPLSSSERKSWKNGVNSTATVYYEGRSLWRRLSDGGFTPQWIDKVKAALPDEKDEWVTSAIEKILPALEAMAEELHRIGVTGLSDLHAGNIMMRGHDLVIVDFGTADVSGAPSIRRL